MSAIADMVSSLKFNNRRKERVPFEKEKKTYKKGSPITSKKFTSEEKEIFLKKLKQEKEKENKLKIYKITITLFVTVLTILGIVFALKYTFL